MQRRLFLKALLTAPIAAKLALPQSTQSFIAVVANEPSRLKLELLDTLGQPYRPNGVPTVKTTLRFLDGSEIEEADVSEILLAMESDRIPAFVLGRFQELSALIFYISIKYTGEERVYATGRLSLGNQVKREQPFPCPRRLLSGDTANLTYQIDIMRS